MPPRPRPGCAVWRLLRASAHVPRKGSRANNFRIRIVPGASGTRSGRIVSFGLGRVYAFGLRNLLREAKREKRQRSFSLHNNAMQSRRIGWFAKYDTLTNISGRAVTRAARRPGTARQCVATANPLHVFQRVRRAPLPGGPSSLLEPRMPPLPGLWIMSFMRVAPAQSSP